MSKRNSDRDQSLKFMRKALPSLLDKGVIENSKTSSALPRNVVKRNGQIYDWKMSFKHMAFFLTYLILSSCSHSTQINKRAYPKMRHGITPVDEITSLKRKISDSSRARGKTLYKENCLSCHGQIGQGDGPDATSLTIKPANLQNLVREVPNFLFFMSISQWQGDMPGWKTHFNEADREDLVTYIKTFR